MNRRYEDDAELPEFPELEPSLALREHEGEIFKAPSAIECERSALLALHRNELLYSLTEATECAVVVGEDQLVLLPYLQPGLTVH